MNHLCIKEVPDRDFIVGKIYIENYAHSALTYLLRDENDILTVFMGDKLSPRQAAGRLRYSNHFKDATSLIRDQKIETIFSE